MKRDELIEKNRIINYNNFIEKAKKIHNDKYNYSKVNYINNSTPICIICPEHGEFWQTPANHLKYSGCHKCNEIKLGYKTLINKGNKIHNNKYDYSKVNYINYQTKVCIICPKHGEFYQTPANHLTYKQGCPKCAAEIRGYNKRTGLENFINRANEIHFNKYDYSKFKYTNNEVKSIIICPIHGEFLQSPGAHLSGEGCPKCGIISCHNKQRKPLNQFIEECKKIHNNKYDYSKVTLEDYKNGKICIICPEHGEFWQNRKKHLFGDGCPKCNEPFMEKIIENKLIEYNIKYEKQKKFDWLKYKQKLVLDFYLPEYNVAIECQGIQHFIPISYNKKQNKKDILNNFELGLLRDDIKYSLCNEHNIKIFYYSNLNKKYRYKIYNNIDKMINIIINKDE